MELDPRIKSIDCIRSFNTNNDDCLAEEGYFCNYLTSLDNLECCAKGMRIFDDGSRYPFIMKGTRNKYQFFIRKCDLQKEEKRYRPCTLDDFGLNIGDLIRFRKKDDHDFEICTMYMGYLKTNSIVKVILGECYYSFEVLFNEYEWYDRDSSTWEVFGVEE